MHPHGDERIVAWIKGLLATQCLEAAKKKRIEETPPLSLSHVEISTN